MSQTRFFFDGCLYLGVLCTYTQKEGISDEQNI